MTLSDDDRAVLRALEGGAFDDLRRGRFNRRTTNAIAARASEMLGRPWRWPDSRTRYGAEAHSTLLSAWIARRSRP